MENIFVSASCFLLRQIFRSLFLTLLTLPATYAAAFKPSIAAGGNHTLQIRADGTLWAWGRNDRGQLGDGTTIDHTAPVQIASGYAQVAAGFDHTVAIKTDGTLWAWGNNYFGQLGDGSTTARYRPIQIGSGYAQVAAGYDFTLAVKTDGTLWAWGNNNDAGKLGDGTSIQHSTPIQIGSGYVQVAAGYSHAAAVKMDGTLWTWGSNGAGELGDGTKVAHRLPIQIGSGYAQVAAGGQIQIPYSSPTTPAVPIDRAYTMAVKTDGTLWAWGDNVSGQLGDGTLNAHDTPTQVGTDYVQVAIGNGALGNAYTLARKTDNTLWAWGNNATGQLGDGTTTSRRAPEQIARDIAQVAAGDFHGVAIKTDGTTWTWGEDTYGQLGDGALHSSNTPVRIDTGYAQVAAGARHSAAIKTDGTLWTWGNNDFGQVGDGTTIRRDTPVQIGNSYRQVAAGSDFSVAIKTDGTLWAWGNNDRGQLGGGTHPQELSPIQIGSGYASVAASNNAAIAIKADGTLWTWKTREYGQFEFPPPFGSEGNTEAASPVQIGSGYTMVAAGASHAVAIKTNGTLWAWGDNSAGELGDGTTTNHNEPVMIGSGYIQATAGLFYTVAVKSDGSLWGWGANRYGQLGDTSGGNILMPIQIGSGYTQVATGEAASHVVAIKPDTTLWAVGNNGDGQLGNGSGESQRSTFAGIAGNYAMAAVGGVHTLAVKQDGSLFGWGSNYDGQLGLPNARMRSTPTQVLFPATAAAHPRLVSISSRANTLNGDNVVIAGFIITGGSKTVLISARGPSLAAAGVSNVLANPKLRLVDSNGKVLANNDDWGSSSNAQDMVATQGAPSQASESAILITLAPGAYTAIMEGVDNGTGNGLVAVDGVSNPADSGALVNISTRAMVGIGDNVLIAGVIIVDGPRKVLLTARGASLTAAGVSGALADPMIELHDASGALIDQNDDAGSAPNAAEIVATGKAPAEAHESAILRTLQPGAYTLVVRGKSASQGVALVAVDQID